MEYDLDHTIAGRIRETTEGNLQWTVRTMHNRRAYRKGTKPALFGCAFVWILCCFAILLSGMFDLLTSIFLLFASGFLIVGIPAITLGLASQYDRSLESYEMNPNGIKCVRSRTKEVLIPYETIEKAVFDTDGNKIRIFAKDGMCELLLSREDYEFAEDYLLEHVNADTEVRYES